MTKESNHLLVRGAGTKCLQRVLRAFVNAISNPEMIEKSRRRCGDIRVRQDYGSWPERLLEYTRNDALGAVRGELSTKQRRYIPRRSFQTTQRKLATPQHMTAIKSHLHSDDDVVCERTRERTRR